MLIRAVVQLVIAVLWMLTLPFRLIRHFSRIAEGSFLLVEIDGRVEDFTREPRLWELGRPRPTSLHALGKLVSEVTKDDRVRGVVFVIKSFQGGMATATSLRDTFARIRSAAREVVVHLPRGGGTKEVYIAAGADRVYVGPQASLTPVGFLVASRYLRRTLDKAGLTPEVFAAGRYKSAGEQIARDSMSEPQREQLGAILDRAHGEVVQAIARGRRVDAAHAAAMIDGAPYLGDEATRAGLIDGTAYEDELPSRLASDAPDLLDGSKYLPTRGALRMRVTLPRPFLGVIRVHGAITSATRGGLRLGALAEDEPIISAIRAARKNRRCLGVLLHIDSPGGSALASDRMHHELEQLAKEKPLVACMANVAASGGYYVAAPAHAIVAQPTTITGSIGVVAARVIIAPLLERAGVVTEVVKRGARAGLLDATMPFSEDERAALEREIAAIYRAFVDVVARGRRRDRSAIERVAEGRVWTGADALDQGLVDNLGGFDVALDVLRARIGPAARRLEPRLVSGARRSLPLPPPGEHAAVLDAVASLAGLAGLAGLELRPLVLGASGERVLAWCPEAAALG